MHSLACGELVCVYIYHCKKGFVILTVVFLTRIATFDMV